MQKSNRPTKLSKSFGASKLTPMPNPHQHPIHTAHDLAAALCDLPPACRVVVVDREGRVIACEVLALRVGDALALMVCDEVVEERR